MKQKVERERGKKDLCMLILDSCGALSNARKGYRAAELGTVKGSDVSAIRAKRKQQQAVLKSMGLKTSYSGAQVLLPCSQSEQRKEKTEKRKVWYGETDVVWGCTCLLASFFHRQQRAWERLLECWAEVEDWPWLIDWFLQSISSCLMWPPAKCTVRL